LFRTVHFPKFNEFPKVGLDDMDQPETLVDYLFSPRPFGKKLKVPVYVFLQEALTRKFGKKFYEALAATAEHLNKK